MKEKLKKLKDKYVKAEYVIPAVVTSVGACTAYFIGYSNGLKTGVSGAFNGLIALTEATKEL